MSTEYTGQFLFLKQFIIYSLPFFPFVIFGLKNFWVKERNLSILALATIALIIAHIPFYTRYYLLLHLVILIISAYGATKLWKIFLSRSSHVMLGFFMLLLFGINITTIIIAPPFLTQQNILHINNISSHIPKSSPLILYNAKDAPWVLGFSGVSYDQLVAPGMFDRHEWNYNEWQTFWTTDDPIVRQELFSKFDASDVYIFVNGSQLFDILMKFEDDNNMHYINSGVWRYNNTTSSL